MTALEFFQQENIHKLPVEPQQIIKNRKIPLYTYASFANLTGDSTFDLVREYGPDGFTTVVDGIPVITYNADRPHTRIKWTLMHEVSHIALGHLNTRGGTIPRSTTKDQFDRQADAFTANVLAPLPVLHKCKVWQIDIIAAMTGLSQQASKIRLENLRNAERYGWGFGADELRGYEKQFSEYIDYVLSGDFHMDLEFEAAINFRRYKSARDTKKRKKNQPPKGRPTYFRPLTEREEKILDEYYAVY